MLRCLPYSHKRDQPQSLLAVPSLGRVQASSQDPNETRHTPCIGFAVFRAHTNQTHHTPCTLCKSSTFFLRSSMYFHVRTNQTHHTLCICGAFVRPREHKLDPPHTTMYTLSKAMHRPSCFCWKMIYAAISQSLVALLPKMLYATSMRQEQVQLLRE